MAPNSQSNVILTESTPIDGLQVRSKPQREWSIVWRNVILFAYLQVAGLYGIYLALTSAKWATLLFTYLNYVMGGLGITAGVHRLWSHKSYKANLPLRTILMIFNSMAFQNSIFEWSRDHRVHHKFSETDADPHNATRGLFFSHCGWLMVKKHPDVMEKGKTVDMSDLLKDPVVAFQKKYYLILMPVFCFLLPTTIPVYFWGETWTNAWFLALARYTVLLHCTWFVNSLAHFYGDKPFDKFINPAENLVVAIGALGEGWHNFHHVFPWDYKAAELGNYRVNFTTFFIDAFAKIGWAYELKTVSHATIQKRALRTGDGNYQVPSHYAPLDTPKEEKHSHEGEVWGWDDKDLPEEEKVVATICNTTKVE